MAYKFNPFTSNFDLTDSATVGAYSSTPIANGLTVTGTAISLHRASSSFPGILDTADYISFTGKQDASAKGQANGYPSLDSNALIPVNQIPPAALERLVIVANQTARFALTTATVQNGDTVLQTDTNIMYFVKDDTNLNNASGYAVYTAGTASSVAWTGITGIPAPVSALLGTNTGDVTIGTSDGLSLSGQVLSLALSSTSTTGALSSTDWNTFNGKQAAGNYLTALTGDGTASGPGSATFTLATVNSNVGSFGSASSVSALTVNAKGLVTAAASTSIQIAESQVTGLTADLAAKLTSVSVVTANGVSATSSGGTTPALTFTLGAITPSSVAATGTVTGSNLSNTNTGDVTLAAVGAVPNANGASLSSQVLTLQPADGTHPGLLTAIAQTIGGAKTFANTISASNLSGTNTGDVSIGTPNGLSITGQQISLALSSTSTVGALSSNDWNTFNGKQNALTFGNLSDTGTDGIIITNGGGAVIGTGTTIAQHVADSTHNGYLSSTDWSTFNAKQPAGSYPIASTGDINETSFAASNNVSSAANVTGFAFANATVRAFSAQVSVFVNATSSLYEHFTIRGIQKAASWDINIVSVGDNSGFNFTIVNSGQIQYTNSNYAGFSAATVKFRAITTSV